MPITAACALKGAKKDGEGLKVKMMSEMQEILHKIIKIYVLFYKLIFFTFINIDVNHFVK